MKYEYSELECTSFRLLFFILPTALHPQLSDSSTAVSESVLQIITGITVTFKLQNCFEVTIPSLMDQLRSLLNTDLVSVLTCNDACMMG